MLGLLQTFHYFFRSWRFKIHRKVRWAI